MKKPIIKIVDMEYTYPGTSKVIIKKFSQELNSGEVLGVVGRNGVGKSTLMRLLAGLHQPVNGNIFINDIDSQNSSNRKEYLQNFCYISHDKILLGDYTISEYFNFYSCLYPNYSKEIEKSLVESFHLDYSEKISNLSTGNKIKVYVLFALAAQVQLIIADEITAVLDPENREEFFELVLKFKNDGVTFIIATNIVDDLVNVADSVWFIDKGQIELMSTANVVGMFKKKAS